MGKLGEQMLYNPPTIPDEGDVVVKGYTKKQVKKRERKAAEKAAKETAANWKKYADFQRVKKLAKDRAITALFEGRLDINDAEAIKQFIQDREREFAEEIGLDFDSATERFK